MVSSRRTPNKKRGLSRHALESERAHAEPDSEPIEGIPFGVKRQSAPPNVARQRLDVALVERGLCETRQKAAHLVMAGEVKVNDTPQTHASRMVSPSDQITVRQRSPWVGRGAEKLNYALSRSGWNVEGLVALDVGASTGGFTDVLLQAKIAKVYAVDVGRGQLHWRIRSNPRVVVKERLNARFLSHQDIPEPIDLIVCDVSFISATMVLPPAFNLLRGIHPASHPVALSGFFGSGSSGGHASSDAPVDFNASVDKIAQRLVILVKPQFEASRGWVGRGGIVRSAEGHAEACGRISDFLDVFGWTVTHWLASPITGADGNQEFLACAVRKPSQQPQAAI